MNVIYETVARIFRLGFISYVNKEHTAIQRGWDVDTVVGEVLCSAKTEIIVPAG